MLPSSKRLPCKPMKQGGGWPGFGPCSTPTGRRSNLVDLGTSAGLNLVAERRAYRLQDKETGATLADVGLGEPVQFVTQVTNSESIATPECPFRSPHGRFCPNFEPHGL